MPSFPRDLQEDIDYILEGGSGEFVYNPINRGFIFSDGTVMELSYGEDHRAISPDLWDKYNIVTYHASGDEVNIRVNQGLSWEQYSVIAEWLNYLMPHRVYIDYWTGDKAIYKNFDGIREALRFLSQIREGVVEASKKGDRKMGAVRSIVKVSSVEKTEEFYEYLTQKVGNIAGDIRSFDESDDGRECYVDIGFYSLPSSLDFFKTVIDFLEEIEKKFNASIVLRSLGDDGVIFNVRFH